MKDEPEKTWQIRHQGSPRVVKGLSLEEIGDGLRDGQWEETDEVLGPADKDWIPIGIHPRLAELAAELEPVTHRRHEEATSIDMNALIDVCLVLLIFFILTTTYANAVQKVVPMATVKADGKKAPVVSPRDIRKRMIRLRVTSKVLRVENQTVFALDPDGTIQGPNKDKLKEVLATYVKGEGAKNELLLDFQDVRWGTVIAIQDVAKDAGVRTIHYLMRKGQ